MRKYLRLGAFVAAVGGLLAVAQLRQNDAGPDEGPDPPELADAAPPAGDDDPDDQAAWERFRAGCACEPVPDWRVLHLYPPAERADWYPADWNALPRLAQAPPPVCDEHLALLDIVKGELAAAGTPFDRAALDRFNAAYLALFARFVAPAADPCDELAKKIRAWDDYLGPLGGRTRRWDEAADARLRAVLDGMAGKPVTPLAPAPR